jgi:2-oxoisovalerate dehydrogenase E1 component subunit beta
VSYGAMMVPTLKAADALGSEHSVSTEVIDLRTISPLDFDTVLASVRKTGRVAIVHEAPLTLGVGAEVAATMAGKAIEYLKAPIARVAGYDTVVPLARLEDEYLPGAERIADAVLSLMKY